MIIRASLLVLVLTAFVAGLNGASAEKMKVAINPDHLMDTTQYGYSQATVVSAGAQVIYIAGQIGINDGGPNDFESQVDRAFDNLFAVLDAAGGHVEDIVKITLLIKDHDEKKLQYLVAKRREVFGENPPASTLIPVLELAFESIKFEIDAIAIASQ